MLEENATKMRKEEKGKKILAYRSRQFDIFWHPTILVLPSEQGPRAVHWNIDEETLARWKAYRTVSPLHFSVSHRLS